ncbi:MAG: peptide-methionine (S)-S-oxide reductase [Gammaproteobacteria bacterium HGW-Gammaproteobacteria-3]|nr:MAG: peptide-methionine (S)-S-oxide reductase [Gammaproteobacteria bacterium HGW-Gammaproteobacteria-3]
MMLSTIKTLPGRDTPMPVSNRHYVNGHPILPPFPAHLHEALFGIGCFWGAEKKFWQIPGVFSTAVGFSGGDTPNPTYDEVCSGLTGHAEVVKIVFDPAMLAYEKLLTDFWQSHNPTQGMRQGNDCGTQYRSCIYFYSPEQEQAAFATRDNYQSRLTQAGYGMITTQILAADIFYYAEDYHQQYLAKNPQGYCGLGGLPVSF